MKSIHKDNYMYYARFDIFSFHCYIEVYFTTKIYAKVTRVLKVGRGHSACSKSKARKTSMQAWHWQQLLPQRNALLNVGSCHKVTRVSKVGHSHKVSMCSKRITTRLDTVLEDSLLFGINKTCGTCVTVFVCLFDLILYVPSTIFQLNRDGSSWVEPARINVSGSRTTTQFRRWGSNLRPFYLESSTLPQSHCAPLCHCTCVLWENVFFQYLDQHTSLTL